MFFIFKGSKHKKIRILKLIIVRGSANLPTLCKKGSAFRGEGKGLELSFPTDI